MKHSDHNTEHQETRTQRARVLARQDAFACTTNLFQEAILEITNTHRILNDKGTRHPTQGENQ
jgi:hypothetical protein